MDIEKQYKIDKPDFKKNPKFKEFFLDEMKKAFFQGRTYQHLEVGNYDLDISKIDDKNLPFHDWFEKHYKFIF